LIYSLFFNNVPKGNFPSGEYYLALAKSSAFSLEFLSIKLNLAIVIILALIEAIFYLSCSFFSSFKLFMIYENSTSLLCLLMLSLSFETIDYLLSILSIISAILSDKNGRDQENKSKLFGRLNGCSTSLYYLIFILSFSIRITAPLFL